jgi:hypothetical protein
VSKSARSIMQSLVLAGVFSAVGFGLGAGFINDMAGDETDTQTKQSDLRSQELQKIREALAQAKSKIKRLEEGLELAHARGPSRKTSLLPTAALPAGAGQSAKDLVAKLNSKISSLETDLAAERKKTAPLSDEDMAEKVRGIRDKFDDAFASKSGAEALKAMKELSKLDSRAYQTLVELWGQMEKSKWLGLGWRERRGWANADLFHWALKADGGPVSDPKLAADFRKQAVWLLGWYEEDSAKKAETYSAFLATLPLPGELTEEQKKKRRGRRGMQADNDLYRSSLRSLSRIPSSATAQLLASLVNNSQAPSDIRLTAVRGLARQRDESSHLALKQAANDPDPLIRRTAELGLLRRDPPIRGYLITDVTKGSQAAGLGIEAGSIIVGSNGKTMTSSRDLFQSIYSSKTDVVVSVYKNGAVQTYTFKGGQRLGVDGEDVAPKAQ